MRSTGVRVLAVLTLFTAHAARADRPWVVGEFGDFSRIEFRGNDSFSRETLVAALDSDFAMLKASRPLATLAMLLSAIETELTHGYRHQGFPWAAVTIQFDEVRQLITADIQEGQRCTNGPIVVVGVNDDLAALLREALSRHAVPRSPASPPEGATPADALNAAMAQQQQQTLWNDEKHTSFTDATQDQLRQRIIETIQQAGYLDAHAEVELVPDLALGRTELRIHANAGAATTIGAVEVVGAERHTSDEIQAYLGITVGQPCDLFTRRTWEGKLESSGRFAAHSITTEPIPGQAGAQRVLIELTECEEVPLLSEPLNEVDLALLRATEWLAHPENFGGDICVRGEDDLRTLCGYFGLVDGVAAPLSSWPDWLQGAKARFELVLSPLGESVLAVDVISADTQPLFGYAFEFSASRTAFYSSGTTNCLAYETDDAPLPSANITFIRVPTTSDGRRFSMMFGMGVNSDSGGLLQIRMTPAFILSQAHSEVAQFEIQDGVLFAEWEDVRSQFDVATGRLIRCECVGDGGSFVAAEILPDGISRTITGHGVGGEGAQLDRGQAPALAVCEFLSDEAAWWANRLGNSTESSRWEAVSRLLRNFDQSNPVETVSFTTDASEEEESTFTIPANQAMTGNPLAWVGQFVLWGNTAVLARNSAAWQVGREAVSALALGDFTAFVELERLSRDERCGPLTSLYAAELLRFVHPALSQAWANQGLQRLDAVSLAKDLDVLASADTTVGRFLIELLGELGRLPADELQAVFAGIGDEWLDDVITVATNENETPDARRTQLLQILWSAGLKDSVEQRLSDHLQSEMETTQR